MQVTLELLAATLDGASAASTAPPPARETVVAAAPVGGGVDSIAAVAAAVSTAGSKLLSRSRHQHCGSGGSSGSSGGSGGSGSGTSAGAGEKLAGPSLRLTDRGDGSYQIRLVRHAAADYLVSVSLQGRKLPSSILCRVEPGPAHAPSCPIVSVKGDAAGESAELAAALRALKGKGAELAAALAPDGLSWAFEGGIAAASLRAYDRCGNRRPCGGDQWTTSLVPSRASAAAWVDDQGDGSYVVSWRAPAGRYRLVIVDGDGKHVRGSPFAVVSLRPVNESSLAHISASDDGTRCAVAGQWNELRLVLEPSYEAAPRLAAALLAALRLEARPVASAANSAGGAAEGGGAAEVRWWKTVEVQTRLVGAAWPAEAEVGPGSRGEAEAEAGAGAGPLTSRERSNPSVHVLRWRPRRACAHAVHLFYGQCEVVGSPLMVAVAAGAPHADHCELVGLAHEIGEIEAGETVAGWLLLRDCCGNPAAAHPQSSAPKKQLSRWREVGSQAALVTLSVEPEPATLDQRGMAHLHAHPLAHAEQRLAGTASAPAASASRARSTSSAPASPAGRRHREAGGAPRSRGDSAEIRRDAAETISSDELSHDMGIVSHRDICRDYAEVLATLERGHVLLPPEMGLLRKLCGLPPLPPPPALPRDARQRTLRAEALEQEKVAEAAEEAAAEVAAAAVARPRSAETHASLARREWRQDVARALRAWEGEKDARTAAENAARAAEPRPLGGMALQRSNSLPRNGVRARAATPGLGTPPRSAALRDAPGSSPPRSPTRSPTRSPGSPVASGKLGGAARRRESAAAREERWDGMPLMFRLTVAGWCKPRRARTLD